VETAKPLHGSNVNIIFIKDNPPALSQTR